MAGGTRLLRKIALSAAAGAAMAALLSAPAGALGLSLWADHRSVEQQAAASPVLALARCYGRYIGWRDELAMMMKATTAYTPLPEDPPRFDRLEAAFVAHAAAERHLTLLLRPTFAEKDFPGDLRRAFRAGVSESGAAFGDPDYKLKKTEFLADTSEPPIPRMQKLETLADAAFAPLGEPCDRLSAPKL